MKNAFITGANIGQANLLTKALAERGWRVFAGVLPGAPTDLKTGGNITVVDQDVSKGESVKASAEFVTQALNGEGLDLLMNVAGVANIGTGVLEAADFTAVERLFNINMFGQLRVIQAFLPLIRKNAPGSRIANYSSGAILANPVGAGAYNMTKHAIHGMTLTLRHELAPFGVQVTSIIPGGVLTAMSANSHANTKKTWNEQPDAIRKVYEPHLGKVMMQVLPDMLEKTGATPEHALAGTLVILDKKKWKPMEYLGKDVKPMGVMRRLLSDSQLEAVMRKTFKVPGYKA
ncbi:SDR family NAD(P)-dependent oxidoreductase [Solimonas terrae]|uniref:SDR family NAD(P)-dependent oxidoreductase n=1 Tax=Solimonas terrae TaxID=1396819 RepID=A0A6M2BSA0_9GAMM|nr:SDR family NAD(P)-dependent oxidoreductase [Solimonas terrae]NGY04909.1 SDR family NAD(P)-dependent oxidoreductase [Solimonas terrae]